MTEEGRWFARVAGRETVLLALAALAAILFLNHDLFYLRPGWRPYAGPPVAYVILTLVLYLLIRTTLIVGALREPRPRFDLELCPECGQPLEDPTPRGLDRHRAEPLTPRPNEKEVLAAVALRRATDEARATARFRAVRGPSGVRALRGDFENVPPELRRGPDESETLVIKRELKDPRRPPVR